MQSALLESLTGFLSFCTYFGSALGFSIIFCYVYCWITPYDELALVREGKIAPAVSFGGALIGFILPLASAITHSVSLMDMLIWAVIAMFIQTIAFGIVRVFYKDLVREIENNHAGAAVLLAFFSIAIGILNAASMSY